jgi:hypothetical protein
MGDAQANGYYYWQIEVDWESETVAYNVPGYILRALNNPVHEGDNRQRRR